MLPADPPHVGAVEIGLRNARESKDGDDTSQLNRHQPPCRLSRDKRPSPIDDAISPSGGLFAAHGLLELLGRGTGEELHIVEVGLSSD